MTKTGEVITFPRSRSTALTAPAAPPKSGNMVRFTEASREELRNLGAEELMEYQGFVLGTQANGMLAVFFPGYTNNVPIHVTPEHLVVVESFIYSEVNAIALDPTFDFEILFPVLNLHRGVGTEWGKTVLNAHSKGGGGLMANYIGLTRARQSFVYDIYRLEEPAEAGQQAVTYVASACIPSAASEDEPLPVFLYNRNTHSPEDFGQ